MVPCSAELLVIRDVVIARLPDLFRHEILYPDDEDVLVVRAVVDGELAQSRRVAMHSPEEVVLALLERRDTEGHDMHPARIEAAGDVLDGAVFAPYVASCRANLLMPFGGSGEISSSRTFAPGSVNTFFVSPPAAGSRPGRAPR